MTYTVTKGANALPDCLGFRRWMARARAAFERCMGFPIEKGGVRLRPSGVTPVPPQGGSGVPAMPELVRAEAIALGPDDIIVLKLKRRASEANLDGLRDALKRQFGDRKVVICEEGIDLEFVRPATADHTEN